ncbi:MAG: DUF2244 domain-containing protein [Alphaproteobacteria bacterium]|nr:DUF2244 domain-containing protein [Alphaproteobacteria bacterium]
MPTAKDDASATSAEPVVFDATLTPYRSLTPAGFAVLMTVLGGFSAALGVLFVALGAWPVVGFLGLDVLLVYLAFRWSYRTARGFEAIRLTPQRLVVRSVDHWGDERRSEFAPPHWLRVDVVESTRQAGALMLSSHGRRLAIGRFLTTAERGDLARTLRAALASLAGPDDKRAGSAT